MSQQVLGDGIGVSYQQVQKYEGGVNRVTAGTLLAVSKALGVPYKYFLEGIV